MKKKSSQKTKCVHSGTLFDKKTGGAVTPIYPSTSYEYLDLEKRRYPRYFNTPNQEALIEKLCALEYGESGLILSSGMAAISTSLLSFLKKGDHVVFQKRLYGGTTNFISTFFEDFDLHYSVTKDFNPSSFNECIMPNTKVIYIETPSNPLLQITDIAAIAELAKSNNIVTM